jgi:hypothetical protein
MRGAKFERSPVLGEASISTRRQLEGRKDSAKIFDSVPALELECGLSSEVRLGLLYSHHAIQRMRYDSQS